MFVTNQEGMTMTPVSFKGTYIFNAPKESNKENSIKNFLCAIDAKSCDSRVQCYEDGNYTGEKSVIAAVVPTESDFLLELYCIQKGITFSKLLNNAIADSNSKIDLISA